MGRGRGNGWRWVAAAVAVVTALAVTTLVVSWPNAVSRPATGTGAIVMFEGQ